MWFASLFSIVLHDMGQPIWLYMLEYALSQAQLRYIDYVFNAHMCHVGHNKTTLYKPNVVPCCIGYECESSVNSYEVNIGRQQPIHLLSDLVLYDYCDRMLSFAD